MSLPAEEADDRVLVLTPAGRDAEMIVERLRASGLRGERCESVDALIAAMARPAGAALIATEALVDNRAETLLAALEAQEPWSDLPVFLLSEGSLRASGRAHVVAGIFERANVTLLDRPVRVQLLVTTLRAAIRARRRQYQTRDLLRDLQRAVQLSDLFVSILGHDLRTPLTAITLAADSLVHTDDATTTRSASRIQTSAGRMTRMIEQLLDFARFRSGHGIPVAPRAADLGAICRAVVEELEAAHPDARIAVEETGSLAGEWDPDRVAQVISNLVGNAVQHGSGGTPVVLALDGRAPDVVHARIHNQGSIPDAVRGSLFEAFGGGQARSTAARAARSDLGLGLFIAREIARVHGGELTVHSSPDHGTSFELTLPRRTVVAETPPPIVAG
jgi:signal transduction histidine kinase